MKPRISLRQSLQDPNLLGGALTGESWAAWRTLLVAGMGEALTEDERATFRALTGRDRELNVYKKRVHGNRQRLTVLAENSRWSLLCGRVLVSDAVRLR